LDIGFEINMKLTFAVLTCVVGLMQGARAQATSCLEPQDCFCGPRIGGQYALAVAQGDGSFLVQRAWGAGAEPLPDPVMSSVDGGALFPGADAGTDAQLAPFVVGQIHIGGAKVARTEWLLYRSTGFGGQVNVDMWQVEGGLIRCSYANGRSWTVEQWLARFAHVGCVANSNAEIPIPRCSDNGCSMTGTGASRSSTSGLLAIFAFATCAWAFGCAKRRGHADRKSRRLHKPFGSPSPWAPSDTL